MIGASRASEAPSEAIAAGIGIETRPWPPLAIPLSRLGDKHFMQEEKQQSNILEKTITKFIVCKNKMLFLQKYHTLRRNKTDCSTSTPFIFHLSNRIHVYLPTKQVVLRRWTSHVTLNSS
jgi:hypothetical protein